MHWNDPVQSALVFGIGNFFFFLITYGEYSVLTLFSYLALALIFVCGGYVYVTMLRAHFNKEKAENPFQYEAYFFVCNFLVTPFPIGQN